MSAIVVIGGCIVDLISYVERFPRPGETLAGYGFAKGCGGKGANQCFMAKKLGADPLMIAKVGDDNFGHEYLENFQSKGISCDFISVSKKSQTSTAAISVTSDGQNSIVYVPGAIAELLPDDVLSAEQKIAKAKVLLCTFECPQKTLMAALKLAKKYGVKTVVNAAPSADKSYEDLYPLTDIICLNEVEAEDAIGLPVKTTDDCQRVIQHLLEKGCSTVILTLGEKGALLKSKRDASCTHVKARAVEAIDSTGAGDAFMGSFVYFLAEFPHLTMKETTERACEIATRSVLKKGTQSSFPDREELPEDFFR